MILLIYKLNIFLDSIPIKIHLFYVYFQELLLLEQTKTLAANIYEAFSQIEETDDPQP
jgi:hypothetical protein